MSDYRRRSTEDGLRRTSAENHFENRRQASAEDYSRNRRQASTENHSENRRQTSAENHSENRRPQVSSPYSRYSRYEARGLRSDRTYDENRPKQYGYNSLYPNKKRRVRNFFWLIPICIVFAMAAAVGIFYLVNPGLLNQIIHGGLFSVIETGIEEEKETETEPEPEFKTMYIAAVSAQVEVYEYGYPDKINAADADDESGESYAATEYDSGNNDSASEDSETETAAAKRKKEMVPTGTLCRGTAVIFMDETMIIGGDEKIISEADDNPEDGFIDAEGTSYDADDESHDAKTGEEAQAQDGGVSSGGTEYSLISIDNKEYYILSENLTEDFDSIALETVKYVRTSVTVYENSEGPEIASFIKKGEELEITGFAGLNADGTIDMYKIKGPGADGTEAEGYVYSKYLVDTKEEADAVYNENGTYDIHKDRTYYYELYGGSTTTLDYYPYEKPSFEDNELMQEAMSMYITAEALLTIDDYIALAVESGVNTMVVDIKDGYVCVELETTKELCPPAFDIASFTTEQYKEFIDKIKAAGIYTIGRIVVFNDSQYGSYNTDSAIISSYMSSYWPSAYSRDAWYYNVCLAIECVETFGFNEIQFDYVRFPEASYSMSQDEETDFKNVYNEEKAEAIQNFMYYACDQVHKTGAYLSVDVFGECSDGYVTAYGQYWPAISNVVDAISGMPYTDHFGDAVDTWSEPYDTVYSWALKAAERQTEIPTPAVARTWVTCYNVPNWNPTVVYDAEKIEEEVQALYDAGLMGGFMPWNGSASIEKYYEVAAAWSYRYAGSSGEG